MENSKKIVVYYSYTGHTKMIVDMIKSKINCDILELKPKVPYKDNYDEVVREEHTNEALNHLREIEDIKIDLSKYEKIIYLIIKFEKIKIGGFKNGIYKRKNAYSHRNNSIFSFMLWSILCIVLSIIFILYPN